MSSDGDIEENTKVASQTISWVAHYFSNSFQKLTGNKYCSKLEKESVFRSYTLRTYLVFPWKFESTVILKLFPEQIQDSGIFRTGDIKNLVNTPCENLAY